MSDYSHPDTMRCKACRWWVRGFKNAEGSFGAPFYGDCRFNAPVALSAENGSDFARTHFDDFCSKFEAAPAACPVKAGDRINLPWIDEDCIVIATYKEIVWFYAADDLDDYNDHCPFDQIEKINGVPFPKSEGGAL